MLLAGIIPQILAPKGYAGREKVVAGFQKYFATSGHKTASNLIQEQIEILERYGVGSEDIARFESVRGFAILRNALPTAFWTLYHIFATPRILARVREQVTTILTVDNTNTDTRYCTIDLARLDEAPVLASVVQESLRMYALGASARIVLQDTMLQSRWLLKKDSYIFMPNRATHFDTASWGPSANTFDAQRFEHIKSGRDKVAPGAFQGFGGGQNSCPGRHFAMMQIVALVAMMALRFDVMSAMEKMDGDDWVIPMQDEGDMSLVISPPKGEVLVEVVPRQGWEGRQWVFKL